MIFPSRWRRGLEVVRARVAPKRTSRSAASGGLQQHGPDRAASWQTTGAASVRLQTDIATDHIARVDADHPPSFGSDPNRRTCPSGSPTLISQAQGKFSGRLENLGGAILIHSCKASTSSTPSHTQVPGMPLVTLRQVDARPVPRHACELVATQLGVGESENVEIVRGGSDSSRRRSGWDGHARTSSVRLSLAA